jgi:hypothetical protein
MAASMSWRKSTFSDQSDCVEVAFTETAAVRDSKNTTGPHLTLTVPAFQRLVAEVSQTIDDRG